MVSIIVVVYNAADSLEETIISVLEQDYPNKELVIIDGGSSDESLNIIKKYEHNISYWISEPDKGIYDAMNKGIYASSGKWIFFLGADDIFYSSNTLSEIFKKEEANIDFLYGNVQLKNSNKILGGERDYNKLLQFNIPHQAIFYKKTIFNKFGPYNIAYKILADYDLNLKIFRDASVLKQYTPAIVTVFDNKGVSNYTIDSAFFKDQLIYLRKKENLSAWDYRLQQYYFYYGFSLLMSGRLFNGINNIVRGILTGKRKIYFFLVASKFFASMLKIGKRIKLA
jgi:glycosyltransferase involved in cell wall biosynthesis